jgi:hypothetical protein
MGPAYFKARRISELKIITPGIGPVHIIYMIVFSQLFGHNVICRLQAAVKLHLREDNDVLTLKTHVALTLPQAFLSLNRLFNPIIISFNSTVPDSIISIKLKSSSFFSSQ